MPNLWLQKVFKMHKRIYYLRTIAKSRELKYFFLVSNVTKGKRFKFLVTKFVGFLRFILILRLLFGSWSLGVRVFNMKIDIHITVLHGVCRTLLHIGCLGHGILCTFTWNIKKTIMQTSTNDVLQIHSTQQWTKHFIFLELYNNSSFECESTNLSKLGGRTIRHFACFGIIILLFGRSLAFTYEVPLFLPPSWLLTLDFFIHFSYSVSEGV